MKYLIKLALIIILTSCNSNIDNNTDHNNCYDVSLIHDNPCQMDCPGVIGCDGLIYCNECEANRQGIEVVDQLQSFYRDQTQCSDEWETTGNDSINLESLKNYLINNGVPPMDISMVNESFLDTICRACDCGTGWRFVLKAGQNNQSKLLELGFRILD